MLRIRKLVLAIAAASALSSGVANALGLGELTLKSAQNQPLDAEIELLDVRDLTATEMAPSLASPEDFAKAGVPLATYLEDLTFTPVINPNGRSVLRVTSSKPLPEPVVKFLVQVMWPQGRLLRDYNVLLDQAQAQGEQPAKANITPAVSAGSYTTKRRDTLWQIAARNTHGGTVQQTMLAIQALNPDAFIGNNINQLKIGQVLRLPDQQQVQSIPRPEANREVAEQYAAWREGRRLGPRARQLDATRRGEAGAAPSRINQGDNLRLVSPGGKAGAGEAKALNDKLAVAQESLDTSRRDNDELKSRMTDLQSQLDKLQRLIELKNDQLARLEAQASATAAPAAPAALPGEPAPAAPAQPVVNAQLTPAEPVVAPAPAATDTAPVEAEAPASEEQGVLDQLLGNPLLLGLVAGSAFLVLLLLLLLLARKRKAQQEAEKHVRMARALAEEGERAPDLELPADSFDGLDMSAPSVTLSPAVVAASAAAATAAEKPVQPAVVEAPVADPRAALLAEVDESIARGRLNHAADLLEAAVASDPQRSDLRLKLMEVYARQGDQDAFAVQERKLAPNQANQAEVASLKERFPAMLGAAAVVASAAALASGLDEQYVQELLQEPQAAEAEPEPQVQPEPEPVAALEPEPEPAPAIDEDDLDSAFDLSLGDDLPVDDPLDLPVLDETAGLEALAEPQAAPAAAETDADDDFEALLAQAQAAEPAPELSADDLADFDLDVGDTTPVASGEEAPVDVAAELAAFEAMPEFDPISELELPEDFDLSLSLDDDSPAAKNFASELDDVNAELDKLSQNLESPSLEPQFTAEDAALEPEPLDDLDFDFFSGTDEVATKLDLARAYIDMGDHQGARDILDEVVKDGDDSQRQEASDMLSRLV
ncbi:LysM peptidoglycan-binding domain-containing protein [Pseudomonas fakonensis]|uniref:LysM peptidoglycan-binding domain-containing protein n=1 Tax=Pseudomonas fakonensis TaxID=2842355 RepID=A0ABX8N9V3_9PSED|nr:FimV/HubP family polar landmark protein [Pseudomonas fakonensis]QXH53047.1 LysM peptidoglycan-binding domain-containing protein [Pseudomonas fakonensis]